MRPKKASVSPYTFASLHPNKRPAISVVSYKRSPNGTVGTLWLPMRTQVSRVPRVETNVPALAA